MPSSSTNITKVQIAKLETNYAYLQAELERVNNNLEKLNKVMFHGNGAPPIPQQLVTLKAEVQNIDDSVHEKFQNLDTTMNIRFKGLGDNINSKIELLSEQLQLQMTNRKAEIASGTKVKVAIITALASLLTAIAALLYS
jgi:DNA repair exonuclease SbcCD ATPase subunit